MQKCMKQVAYLWKMLRHPLDGFYDIIYNGKGSILSATIIFVLFYVVQIVSLLLTAFIFNPDGIYAVNPLVTLIFTAAPLLIWVIANYLVSAIKNGQGTMKAIYIGTAYSLAPYIFLSIPLAIISHALTNAEASIYRFLNAFIIGWTALMFYLQVKEVHGYDVVEAFVNLLWMIFAALSIVIFVAAFSAITYQSTDFLFEFVREAIGYV